MTDKPVTRGVASKIVAVKKPARVGRPRGSNKEAKLAHILIVARKQFAEKGFSQTTFRDVGREAGMTHAALYSYFSSKLDLYLATLTDTQGLLLPEYLRAIEECDTLRERFKRILMASAVAHDRDATVTGFLAAVPIEIRRHPELRAVLLKQNNAVFQALTDMFEDAKRTGEINSGLSTENLISAFFGAAVGVALFQYGMRTTLLTDAMSIFVAMIDRGFEPAQQAQCVSTIEENNAKLEKAAKIAKAAKSAGKRKQVVPA